MIRSDYVTQINPAFRMFSTGQIKDLHSAVVHILGKIGIRLNYQGALELLAEAGARVDMDKKLVKIPEFLVEEAIRSAPKKVVLYGSNGTKRCVLENGRVYFGTFGTAPYIYDPVTGERRRVAKKDLDLAARFLNHLPNIEWCQPIGSAPEDCPAELADRYQLQSFLRYYTKPIVASSYSLDGIRDQIEMCTVVAGGMTNLCERPFYVAPIDPTSPLCFGKEPLEKLLYVAERGLPIAVNCAPMSGATSPMTMASTICIAVAESLCALILAQLSRRGTPVILGGEPCPLDMATTVSASGAPEATLMKAGLTELIHYYGLPVYTLGGATGANVPDQQAAIEASLSILTLALSGSNLVQGPGAIDQGMTISFDYLIMCDEIIAQTKRLMAGIPVTESSLQLELIEEIGPGGHFVATDHTFEHFKEFHYSKLIQRQRYDIWAELGKPIMGDLIKDKVNSLINEPETELLSVEIRKELQTIFQRAKDKVERNC